MFGQASSARGARGLYDRSPMSCNRSNVSYIANKATISQPPGRAVGRHLSAKHPLKGHRRTREQLVAFSTPDSGQSPRSSPAASIFDDQAVCTGQIQPLGEDSEERGLLGSNPPEFSGQTKPVPSNRAGQTQATGECDAAERSNQPHNIFQSPAQIAQMFNFCESCASDADPNTS